MYVIYVSYLFFPCVCTTRISLFQEGSLLEGAPLELRGLPIPGTDPAPIETFRSGRGVVLGLLGSQIRFLVRNSFGEEHRKHMKTCIDLG